MYMVVTFVLDELSAHAGYEAQGAVCVLFGEGGADCVSTRVHVEVQLRFEGGKW